MSGFGQHERTFSNYLRQMLKHITASTLPLALVLTLLLLLDSDDEFKMKLTLSTGGTDALWILLALPIAAIIVFVSLAPVSYPVFKLLSGTRKRDL